MLQYGRHALWARADRVSVFSLRILDYRIPSGARGRGKERITKSRRPRYSKSLEAKHMQLSDVFGRRARSSMVVRIIYGFEDYSKYGRKSPEPVPLLIPMSRTYVWLGHLCQDEVCERNAKDKYQLLERFVCVCNLLCVIGPDQGHGQSFIAPDDGVFRTIFKIYWIIQLQISLSALT